MLKSITAKCGVMCHIDNSTALQADACAWLGHWYKDINQNWFKARNCYKRALALQPDSTMIGEHSWLCLHSRSFEYAHVCFRSVLHPGSLECCLLRRLYRLSAFQR